MIPQQRLVALMLMAASPACRTDGAKVKDVGDEANDGASLEADAGPNAEPDFKRITAWLPGSDLSLDGKGGCKADLQLATGGLPVSSQLSIRARGGGTGAQAAIAVRLVTPANGTLSTRFDAVTISGPDDNTLDFRSATSDRLVVNGTPRLELARAHVLLTKSARGLETATIESLSLGGTAVVSRVKCER